MHKSSLRSIGFELIDNFIKSLYKYCNEPFNLYLFDNQSDEKYNVPKYMNLTYTYIKDQSIRGLYILNDGIENAVKDDCDIIILVNDDVVFNETINDFIHIIYNHEYKDIGLYGPLTDGILDTPGSYQKTKKAGKGIRDITKLDKPFGILNGFCLGFTKEFYYKFRSPNGNIAESNNKWSGGEKRLIRIMKQRGGKVFIIKDCWLYHHKIRGWKQIIRRVKRNESKNKTKNTVRRKRTSRR